MLVTKEELRNIVKEELNKMLNEPDNQIDEGIRDILKKAGQKVGKAALPVALSAASVLGSGNAQAAQKTPTNKPAAVSVQKKQEVSKDSDKINALKAFINQAETNARQKGNDKLADKYIKILIALGKSDIKFEQLPKSLNAAVKFVNDVEKQEPERYQRMIKVGKSLQINP